MLDGVLDMRHDAMAMFGVLTSGGNAPWLEPSWSPLGNALAAVSACASAAVTWHGCAVAGCGAGSVSLLPSRPGG
jgi:hypothetical protein